ncbi:uncharacterized protein LOC134763249 [Penaeus indicus]|uniref:uncharacterized protein LOC134763249 n=1 Tax=Penaeus indicus TaxID=29960 RepID=UPI00300C9420
MNLWKPAARKSKKVSSGASEEAAWAGLPDVVADLSLATPPAPPAPTTMLGARDHHYVDMGEARARRRDARPPPPPVTPQGLGAAPAMGAGTNGGGGWRHTPSHPWPSPPPVEPTGAGMGGSGMGVCGGSSGVSDAEGARVRSISSDGRGPPGAAGDRRVRCSSATRSRQHRPRPPPADRPPGGASVPSPASLPPAGGGHGGQQSYGSSVASAQPGAGVGAVGGVLARLAGCHEGLEGREPEGGAYGYQVRDLEALLTRASPARPANLPMVLASATRLHNMRRTAEPRPHNQPPVRPFLPLGIIVNAVFKTRDWLYVRTAHGAEGYVPYRVCLPLGILPPPREGGAAPSGTADVPGVGVWENRTDMFQGAMSQFSAAPAVASGAMGGVNAEGGGGQTRGRSRGRRRAPCVDSSNQTDTQKLQPGARSASESRAPRETLDSPPAADHVLV